jgi:hypothetical protein
MPRVLPLALASALAIGVVAAVAVPAAGPTTRTVYVTVVNDQGTAVPGLTPADFVVKEGGKEREIAAVAPASEKMRLALMVEQPLAGLSGVRIGLAEFVARISPSADIGLFLVHQRSEKLVDFTPSANAMVNGIRNLPLGTVRATTAAPEAVGEVAKLFEKEKPARPVMVFAAIEHAQEADAPSILSQLAKSKAQFWAVAIQAAGAAQTSGGVQGLADSAGRAQVLGDGSKQSGGRRVEVMMVDGFQRGLQQVADDLSSQYLITYTLPDGVRPSDRIDVSLKKPGATLRAPSRVPNK